jgi:hypothetical protein
MGALSIQSIPSRVENQMPGRRFPAPWSSEEHSAYYVVRDGNGQAIAYIYYENASRPAVDGKAAYKRRGAEDCGEYRQAAGVVTA